MDKDRTTGTTAQTEVSEKQAISTITGGATLEVEGTAQATSGEARKTLGLAKSKTRAAFDVYE